MEDWRAIRSFPRYSVSTLGRVRNEKTDRLVTMSVNQRGFVIVGLMRDKVQYKRSVTGLVARAFLPPPPNDSFDTPINLNGERTNNYVENLTWRPRWFARKYYWQFLPNAPRGFMVPVEERKTGEIFNTSWEAAITYGLLDREIFIATLNHTFVWPTYQTFRVIQ
jgi:NUMOD4 motif